jgi:colanic acid biosynthesis glycosyl transferase WcaI
VLPQPILISDYVGHAFTSELTTALRARHGLDVLYAYCASVTSPKGRLQPSDTVIPVSSGPTFEKYKLWRRAVSELRYGLNTVGTMCRIRPRMHVVCNMPLGTLLLIWLAGIPLRTRLVVWFQDAQSGLAQGALGQGIVARTLATLEGFLLRRAHVVVAISDELAAEARRQGVSSDRVVTIENWAPIESLPVLERGTCWAHQHGLTGGPILLYSGTLGKKHRPDVLASLARSTAHVGVTVVVVSEGEGATWLAEEKRANTDLDNLTVLPYQPFERLPEVLASADVLLALLEPTAGRFSVPSKVLSYLCSARPVLASMPPSNTAARILTDRAQAGVVVEPGDVNGFCKAALDLLADDRRRNEMGAAGRAYAESHFSEDVVLQRFLWAIGAGDPVV